MYPTLAIDKPLKAVVVAAWIAVVAGGSYRLMAYGAATGDHGVVRPTWPRSASVAPTAGKRDALLFLHPRCPCSQASMSELERLHARHHEAWQLRIVVRNSERMGDLDDNALVARARALVGDDNVVFDRDGALTRHFGVRTSGHLLLYSIDGRLQFSGGLTAARGHEGVNGGTTTVASLLRGQQVNTRKFYVFGCEVNDNDDG